ncbi:hypothetical protein [Planomonospora alba]
MQQVRMITVKQPWAWAIIHGDPEKSHGRKDIENRSWDPRYTGTLLIHAGKSTDQRGYDKLAELGIPAPYDLEFGVILGSVELVDVVRGHPSPWANPHTRNWVLADPTPATRLLEVRGNQGLLAPPPDWRRAFTDADPETKTIFDLLASPVRAPRHVFK